MQEALKLHPISGFSFVSVSPDSWIRTSPLTASYSVAKTVMMTLLLVAFALMTTLTVATAMNVVVATDLKLEWMVSQAKTMTLMSELVRWYSRGWRESSDAEAFRYSSN